MAVLDPGTSSSSTHAAPAAAASAGSGARPVYLVTTNKSDPTRRFVRDVGRRHNQRGDQNPHDARKHRDEDREAIYACNPYPDQINDLLKRLPKKKSVVETVLERLRNENPPVQLDTLTYNLLLEKVVDLRDDIAFQLYEDMREEAQRDDAAVRPDFTTLQLMIRACERHGDYDRAFQIYSQLKETFNVYPDVALYNTLIGYCAPLKKEEVASYIVEEMRDRFAEPDVHTYNSLMNVFANAPYEVILQTYEDMIKRRLKPNRRTYNTLMRACQRIGEYEKTFLFFEEMRQDGLIPDVTTYNTLFLACRDRIDYLIPPLQQSSSASPNAASRNNETAGDTSPSKSASPPRATGAASSRAPLSKEQKQQGLADIAQFTLSLQAEMEDTRVQPNTFTFNVVLGILGRCGDDRMFDVFEQMKSMHAKQEAKRAVKATQLTAPSGSSGPTGSNNSRALAVQPPPPQPASPSRMLLDGTTTRTVADLERLLDTSRSNAENEDEDPGNHIGATGITLTLATYDTVISGAAQLQLPDRAYAYFDEMKRVGIRPDRDVFMRLLGVCAIKAEKGRAFAVFDEAKQFGVTVDIELHNALLNVLAESCDPQVFGVFGDLRNDHQKLSIKPNQETYNIMLKACYKQKNTSQALLYYQEMLRTSSPVSPDATTYAWLMDVCSLTADVARATDLILDMRRRHIPPEIHTYTKFMNVFVAANDAGIVDVFEGLKRHGPQPNLEAYVMLLSFHLKNKSDAIVALYDDFRASGIEPDLSPFNVMLNYAALLGNYQMAFKFLQELKAKRLVADVETYNALLAVFAPSGSDFIYKVFEEMSECHVTPNSQTFATLMRHKAGRQALMVATERHLIFAGAPVATRSTAGVA